MLRPQARVLVGLAFALLSATSHASDSVRIYIKSGWTGFGKPSQSSVIITGSHGRYRANTEWVDYGSADASAVKELLSAVHASQVQRPALAACGITSAWLQENAAKAVQQDLVAALKEASPAQLELFRRHFTDRREAQRRLGLFVLSAGGWTDDSPTVDIEVNRKGRVTRLSSVAQMDFMLPWKIERGDRTFETYDCRIGRAVARLLPPQGTNAGRLAGNRMGYWFTLATLTDIREEWGLLKTQALAGVELSKVERRFTVLRSDVDCSTGVDVNAADDVHHCRLSWNAKLRRTDLPQNLQIGVSLPYQDGRFVGLDKFEETIDGHIARALSVPWFSEFMKTHPSAVAEVRYVADRSLSTKAAGALVADLHTLGKTSLERRLGNAAAASVFLEVSEGARSSKWVTLPTGEMILWYFTGDHVLNWSASCFPYWNHNNGWTVGALVLPNGQLANEQSAQRP